MSDKNMNDYVDDIIAITKQIAILSEHLTGHREKRACMIASLRGHMTRVSGQLEQMELEEAYAAGDPSVVRDAAAGSGAGGFRRRDAHGSVIAGHCAPTDRW